MAVLGTSGTITSTSHESLPRRYCIFLHHNAGINREREGHRVRIWNRMKAMRSKGAMRMMWQFQNFPFRSCFIYLFICLFTCIHAHATAHVALEDNLQELVVSFHHVSPKIEFRSLCWWQVPLLTEPDRWPLARRVLWRWQRQQNDPRIKMVVRDVSLLLLSFRRIRESVRVTEN